MPLRRDTGRSGQFLHTRHCLAHELISIGRIICVLMGVSSLVFYALAARVPIVCPPSKRSPNRQGLRSGQKIFTFAQQKRLFHFITSLITTIAFLSYFAMATGGGVSLHTVSVAENSSHTIIEITKRQIYWARYVDVSYSNSNPSILVVPCRTPAGSFEQRSLMNESYVVGLDYAAAAPRPVSSRWAKRL